MTVPGRCSECGCLWDAPCRHSCLAHSQYEDFLEGLQEDKSMHEDSRIEAER